MKKVKTVEEYECDLCGKEISAEEASFLKADHVINVVIEKKFFMDQVIEKLAKIRIGLEDSWNYVNERDSVLYHECKKKCLKKALEELEEHVERTN